MKADEIFEEYINLIWAYWLQDLEALSMWWMWAFVLPALGYILFMWIKWVILTMPLWIPIKVIRMLYEKKPSFNQSARGYKKNIEDARLAIFKKKEQNSENN